MKLISRRHFSTLSMWIELFIFATSGFTFLYWLTGTGLFYSEVSPVLSPFTSVSLALMVIPRVASRYTNTWSQPMTLSLLGIVTCGNASSLFIQLTTPELIRMAAPNLVPTSAITSAGLILLCLYEILIVLRKTPKSAFIFDDILLHLALFPGALSLLGHLADVSVYISSGVDPRAGVSFLEMILMASFVLMALVTNPNLYLWEFLAKSTLNRIIFLILFINQYVTSFIFGVFFRPKSSPPDMVGLEFYIMVAGVLATLLFLMLNAFRYSHPEDPGQ